MRWYDFRAKASEPGKIADLVRLLEPQPNEQPLQCTVKIVKPVINYAFQFESGYFFQMPLNHDSAPDYTWSILTEVTPLDGHASPVYFLDTLVLQQLVRIDANMGGAGGYRPGEGRYSVGAPGR